MISSHGLNTDETRKMEFELAHADITEKIIGAAYSVYAVLGYGFLESVSQKAMQVELHQAGLKCEIECPIKVTYRNGGGGDFRADLFVNDVVIAN